EVGVLRPHGLGVVVREERRVLVTAGAGPLAPAREVGVEAGAARLRKTPVRDFARERVLERVLGLALERRAAAAADEVAALQHAEVRLEPAEELVDGAAPERPPDHGGRLERGLLVRREEVDPG